MAELISGRRVLLACAIALACLPAVAVAQSYQRLHSFAACGPSGCSVDNGGAYPHGALVEGPDGIFYGATTDFPTGGLGTIFKIGPTGGLVTLMNFSAPTDPPSAVIGPFGCFPNWNWSLRFASDGALYGATDGCGAVNTGTLFKITTGGAFTLLEDAAGGPASGLVQRGASGPFYGVASSPGFGRVYKFEPGSAPTVLYTFDGTEGGAPPSGDLVLGSDGNLYGSFRTDFGGFGGIFRITAADTVEIVHAFDGTVGTTPNGALIEGADGQLYGTAQGGIGCGTVFRVTTGGITSLVHQFANAPTAFEGCVPQAPLAQGPDGTLYGTTQVGGASNKGTVFQIAPDGTVTVLHDFLGPEGAKPFGGVVIGSDGNLYGTTVEGGAFNFGVVYRVVLRPSNLQVSRLTVPAAVGIGATFSVTDRVKNAGIAPSTPSSTTFWLSTDNVLSEDDLSLGSRSVGAINAGKTNEGSTSLMVGAEVTPGRYYLIAETDGEDDVPESNETDNTRAARVTVGPDYVVSVFALTPATGTSLAPTSISITTKNLGGPALDGSVTRLYKSADAVVDGSDTLLAEFPVGALGAQQTAVSATDLLLPPGKYRLLVVADGAGTLTEVDETNNLSSKSVSLGVDLTVSALTLNPAIPTSTSPTTITMTTRNGGAEPAAGSVTRLYKSTNSTLDGSDEVLAEVSLGPLGAGAASVNGVNLILPAGSYYLLAVADAAAEVAETREGNNLRKVKVNVP